MKTSALRSARPAALVFAALLIAGCGGSDDKVVTPQPQPNPSPPPHDTPVATMYYIDSTYTAQNEDWYGAIFTADYHYAFSLETDPTLVAQYGPNWGKQEEIDSAKHLFDGFTPESTGLPVPGATTVAVTFNSVQFSDDPVHADSSAQYQKCVVVLVNVTVEVPGSPDPTTYQVAGRHEFYLVRGDAAVLDAGQSAASNQWYVRRWDDLTSYSAAPTSVPGGPTTNPGSTISWGSLKGLYH